MKKQFVSGLLAIFLVLFITVILLIIKHQHIEHNKNLEEFKDSINKIELEFKEQEDSSNVEWEALIAALIEIESQGMDSAVNPITDAVGCLQITPILVKEVNTISDKTYRLVDRYNREKSIEMFNIMQDTHNKTHNLRKACWIWNPCASESYYQTVINLQNRYVRNYYTYGRFII